MVKKSRNESCLLADAQEDEEDDKAEINWMLAGSFGVAALLLIGVLVWLFL